MVWGAPSRFVHVTVVPIGTSKISNVNREISVLTSCNCGSGVEVCGTGVSVGGTGVAGDGDGVAVIIGIGCAVAVGTKVDVGKPGSSVGGAFVAVATNVGGPGTSVGAADGATWPPQATRAIAMRLMLATIAVL